jgi:hypothetical protein
VIVTAEVSRNVTDNFGKLVRVCWLCNARISPMKREHFEKISVFSICEEGRQRDT